MNNVVNNKYRVALEAIAKLSEYLKNNHEETDDMYNIVNEDAIKEILQPVEGLVELSQSWNNNATLNVYAVNGNQSINTSAKMVEWLEANRIDFILYSAMLTGINTELSENGYSVDSSGMQFNIGIGSVRSAIAQLDIIAKFEWTPWLTYGVIKYNRELTQYTASMGLEERRNRKAKAHNGLSALIQSATSKEVDKQAIEQQIQAAQKLLHNGLVGRTWGWEVEAPNPGDFTSIPGVEAGTDGSVESYEVSDEDCDCSCRDCNYHECSCDNCEDYNDSPEHCGYDDCKTGRSYEFRTVGGVTRALHPGLKNLLNQIGETEKNETAGTHIHVYARDLSAFQIGTVLAAYALTQKVWDVLAGRDVEDDARCKTYANLIPGEDVSLTLRSKKLHHVGKFNAINTHHVATDRGTLEFRQMNCNYDFERISLMAWAVRGLVEVAKRGATLNEFVHVTDLDGLITIYKSHGYTFEKETEEIDNPYGSRYNQSRLVPQIA